MTALPRLSGESAPEPGERTLRTRRVERKIVGGTITVESSTGQSEEAKLWDFSPFGCNLRSNAEWLRMGKFVTIKLAKSREFQAVVRWVRHGSAGLEFLRPIPYHEAEVIEEFINQ